MRIPDRTIGETIRVNRIRLGLTQQRLADLLNEDLPSHELIERSMISRWEKDLHFPRNARKSALEKLLGVELGDPPPRHDSFTAYMTNASEINKSLELGLQGCDELWITNTLSPDEIWATLPMAKRLFERFRKSHIHQFRELFYLKNLADLEAVIALAEKNYPRYRIRVRMSPAHPLPVLLAPNNKFGVFLSGFSDEIASVGLELNGQPAGFIEHYYRHLWDRAIPILETSDGLQTQNFDKVRQALKNLGGQAPMGFQR